MALFSRHCAHVLRVEREMIGGFDATGGFNPSALADREIARTVYCPAPITYYYPADRLWLCKQGHCTETWRLSGTQKAALVALALVVLVILGAWLA